MPTRGRTSFNKRQKEQQRKERNHQKLARRQQHRDTQTADNGVSHTPDTASTQSEDSELTLKSALHFAPGSQASADDR
jgi:hypothetical protein